MENKIIREVLEFKSGQKMIFIPKRFHHIFKKGDKVLLTKVE